ncbi:Protein NEP-17 a [Aphelenchoides avenae]|nr:Protein NEP-17 a [Aphelenchus avenae]
MLSKALNTSRNPCDSFYEYACERYEGADQVIDDAQKQVIDVVYKAINSSRGKPKPWKKYEQYVDACVASKKNHSSVLDPELAVALVRNFTDETGLRFPLIDGRPVAEWPNGTTLGRALGYLGRIAAPNPLFHASVFPNVLAPESAQPYYLFISNVFSRILFGDIQFGIHQADLDGMGELLEKYVGIAHCSGTFEYHRYANLVGRYITKDDLAAEMKAIERLGSMITKVSGQFRSDDFKKVFNPLTLAGADGAFEGFINFTEYLNSYTSSSSSAVQQRVSDPNYKISLSSMEYFFELKELLSEGNEHGVEAHTLYNLIYVQLLRYYERLFVEPKTIRRLSVDEALLETTKRRRAGMTSLWDRARGEVVLPLSDTMEEAEHLCVAETAVFAMPFASGRVYIDAVLPTEKDRREHLRAADRMVSGILDALQSMIDQITWMSDESKGHAYEKLKRVVKNIGYPEFVLDDELLAQFYSDLDFASAKNNSVLADQELDRFYVRQDLEQLARTNAVDRTEFARPINEVNAGYVPSSNSINIPLAIIQQPFFDKDWPASLNLGGVGYVIGHELTHGFDTNGVKWDSIGRLSPWLDDKSQKAFDEMADCVIREYDHFCPSGNDTSQCVSGEFTQTENIADNAGIRAAFRAYENEIGLNGPDPLLPGRVTNDFNHDQLFFLSVAHNWCAERDHAVKISPYDMHSPPKYRIHGALQNFGAFAAAFNCPKGSEYAPKKHCNVWISEPGGL